MKKALYCNYCHVSIPKNTLHTIPIFTGLNSYGKPKLTTAPVCADCFRWLNKVSKLKKADNNV